MSNSRSARFASGVLFGAAIGTVTGLLLAPRTGREARQLVKKSVQALPELAEDLWVRFQARWQEAIAVGIEAANQQRQVLQARQRED